jgi:hypothetical protein
MSDDDLLLEALGAEGRRRQLNDPLLEALGQEGRRRRAAGERDAWTLLDEAVEGRPDHDALQELAQRSPEWAEMVDLARPPTEEEREPFLRMAARAQPHGPQPVPEDGSPGIEANPGASPTPARRPPKAKRPARRWAPWTVAAGLAAASVVLVTATGKPDLPEFQVVLESDGPPVLRWPADETGQPLERPRGPFTIYLEPMLETNPVHVRCTTLPAGVLVPILTRVNPRGTVVVDIEDSAPLVQARALRFELWTGARPEPCEEPKCRTVDLPLELVRP